MEFIKNLREKLQNRSKFHCDEDNEHEKKLLNKYLDQVISVAYEEFTKNESLDRSELKKRVVENSNVDKTLNQIITRYREMVLNISKLQEIEDRLVSADWGEKWRTILFRILTTVAIAGTILLTGYLSKIWEIPLPFRMGLPVS